MFYILSFLWLIRTTKASLFWIYLWQLKEYHLGRFLDHFRTDKGKKLFLNPVIFFKIALFFYALFLSRAAKLLPWQLYAGWISVLIIIYFLESIKFLKDFFQKTLKKPVLTQKTLILLSLALIVEISFLYILFQSFYFVLSPNFYWFAFSLLAFDILTSLIISIIVFLVHAFTVIFFRNKLIKKAKLRREKFKNLLVVGITGSYGKTSTKEFLFEILSEKATLRGGAAGASKVLKTREHQNSEVGISRCILEDLKPEHEVFICEMGAYNRGGIKLLCSIAQPKIGILTGINEQHMATFKSQESIVNTKFELIENLPENGIAVLNWDNPFIAQNAWTPTGGLPGGLQLKAQNCPLFTHSNLKLKTIKYSISKKEDIWAEDIKVEKEYISFKVLSKDKKSATFKVNLPGVHNIDNILSAVAVARELGMSLREISSACKKITPEQGGMKFLKNKYNLNVIDSTYSANPTGVIADLDYLKIWEGKKVIVMPCLIELGKAAGEVHRRIGQKIGEICDLAIITTKDKLKEIKEGAISAGMREENILLIENPKEIFAKLRTFLRKNLDSSSGSELKDFCGKDDIILLEGRIPSMIHFLIEKSSQ